MAKAGSVVQFILKQIFRSSDVNALTAELGAHPLIGHDESTGVRRDFDIGDPLSGTTGHIVNHIYQRFGYKIKTLDAAGVVVHTADMTAISTIDIPIGGIMWWYKNLTGVPALPSGWVECNGQVLSDPDSLLNGRTMPNINGAGYFLRGSATAGTIQASQNLQHTHIQNSHNHTQNAHNHAFYTPLYSGGVWSIVLNGPAGWNGYDGGVIQTATPTNNVTTAVNQNSGGSEARPINISMVAIIRVK